MNNKAIIEKALAAATFKDALAVQEAIAAAVGARYERPLGDHHNNRGMMTSSGGSFDHKLTENVTNMQDSVLERERLRAHPSAKSPYASPREAAEQLFKGDDYKSLCDRVTVEFRESDAPASRTKRLTAVFRDDGAGMTPEYIPSSIFDVGAGHKVEDYAAQGSFGLGCKTTFVNSKAVVLVSRRAPELLQPGEEDLISVAVAQWADLGKIDTFYYLVSKPWIKPGDDAPPFSVPASECPEFEPGTHLALISYGVEGLHRGRLGDERSFDTVLNTRLFQPILPVRFRNVTAGGRDRTERLRGLALRLDENPGERKRGDEVMPYHIGGTTYHLPIQYHVFPARGEEGERRKFAALGHALLFTSNGQVHKHWDTLTFRNQVKLPKLADRILAVVETDELPIQVRNHLFTADRSDFVSTDDAIKLEDAVASFLGEWQDLVDINGELVREALLRSIGGRTTINVARQIARAFKGLGLGGAGGTGGGGGPRTHHIRPRKPIDLYQDPTTLEGPAQVVAEIGKTTWLSYLLNVVDGFSPRRGELEVTCTHPDINEREITVGQLRGGHIRVSFAVPDAAAEGAYELVAELEGWQKSAGGIGKTMTWRTDLKVVAEIERKSPANGAGPGKKGPAAGDAFPVVWQTLAERPDWTVNTPGLVEEERASDLAVRDEYKELAALGDTKVMTIYLNEAFRPFAKYIEARKADVTDSTISGARDRYAIGVGTGLLVIQDEMTKGGGKPWSEEATEVAARGVARAVLANMPEYDQLASETGVSQALAA